MNSLLCSAGSVAPFTCTVSYAAPETVLSLLRGERTVIVDASVDAWALGVMAYELLTRSRVFPPGTRQLVEETMLGQHPLPWEDTADPEHGANIRRLGWMKEGVLSMLKRNPENRAKLHVVLKSWRAFLQRETTYRSDDFFSNCDVTRE